MKTELVKIYPVTELDKLTFNNLFILLKNGHSVFSIRKHNLAEFIVSQKFDKTHCMDLKDFVKQFNYSTYEVDLMAEFYIEVLKMSKREVLGFDDVKPKKNTLALKILAKLDEAFKNNRHLRILSLSKTLRAYTNYKDEAKIVYSLITHPTLVCLDLSHNFSLNNEAFSNEIKNLLINNKVLKKLNLNENKGDSESHYQVFSGLSRNVALKQLFYSNNNVTSTDCKAISDMLSINKSLVFLSLDNNNIENFGFEQLCRGLLNNNSLKSLSLRKNSFCNKIFDILKALLENNKSLTTLDISLNVNLFFSDEQKKYLESNHSGRLVCIQNKQERYDQDDF